MSPRSPCKLAGSKESPEAYTRRQTQRFFRDYWQDAFFKPGDSLDTRTIDDKFTPFNSVFDSSELPRTETSEIAEQMNLASNLNALSNPRLLLWLKSSSALEFIIPDFLEDMRSFKEKCLSVMAQEKKNLPKAYSMFLASELNFFSPLFETFYKHVSSIFAWKWFLLQTPEDRQWMFDEAFPLEYSESDATRAREILLSLASSNDTRFFLSMGAIELVERARIRASQGIKDAFSMARAAVALYNECLRLEGGLSSLDQAIMFENIAIAYRGTGNYKLMVINMKKALELYDKASAAYLKVCFKVFLPDLTHRIVPYGTQTVQFVT